MSWSRWRTLKHWVSRGFWVSQIPTNYVLFFSYTSSTTKTSVVYLYPPQAAPMSLEDFKLSIGILACYLYPGRAHIGKLHTPLSEFLYCKKSHGMLNSCYCMDTFHVNKLQKSWKTYPELVPSKESMCETVTLPVIMCETVTFPVIMMPPCPLLSRSKTLTLATNQQSEKPARLGWWKLNNLWKQTKNNIHVSIQWFT